MCSDDEVLAHMFARALKRHVDQQASLRRIRMTLRKALQMHSLKRPTLNVQSYLLTRLTHPRRPSRPLHG